jgi:hypothetical protein
VIRAAPQAYSTAVGAHKRTPLDRFIDRFAIDRSSRSAELDEV